MSGTFAGGQLFSHLFCGKLGQLSRPMPQTCFLAAFAQKVSKRRRSGKPTVNIYEFDEEQAFAECAVLQFESADEAWLDFVVDNRAGMYQGPLYDYVFGPVADDDVYTTFILYSAGILTKEQTVETLKIKKLYNQLVLTSEKALSYLKYTGTLEVL